MKILIAGAGSIGKRHFRNLAEQGVRDFVFLSRRPFKSAWQAAWQVSSEAKVEVETDLKVALEKHQPHAVVVSNPTALHLDVAIPAAAAGCHLLLEKPISHNMERVWALHDIVKAKKLKVLVGFQFRFHPGLATVRQYLLEKRIGDVTSVGVYWGENVKLWHPEENYKESYAVRSDLGGGVVRTLCHPFDYLRWLFGEVESVSAMTGNRGGLQIDVEDTADVLLRFKSGVIGNVHLDYIQTPSVHAMRIAGTEGVLNWNANSSDVGVCDAPKQDNLSRNSYFMREAVHFLDCISIVDKSPQVTLDDGMAALRIILAVFKSVEQRYNVLL